MLHQQDGHLIFAIYLFDVLKNVVHDRRRQTHRGLVEHEYLGPCSQTAPNRNHLLLTARERPGQLALTLFEFGKQRVDLLQGEFPVGTRVLGLRAHFQVLQHSQVFEYLTTFRNMCNAHQRTLGRRNRGQISPFEHDAPGFNRHGA